MAKYIAISKEGAKHFEAGNLLEAIEFCGSQFFCEDSALLHCDNMKVTLLGNRRKAASLVKKYNKQNGTAFAI